MIPVMRSRYSAGLRRIHWLTVVLVAAAYILVEQRGLFPRGSDGRTLMLQGHFIAGLSVFAFALWRIALRLRNDAPPVSPAVDKVLGHRLEDLHGTIGEVFYWIIGLHVVAALYHHLWRRDDTLRRML